MKIYHYNIFIDYQSCELNNKSNGREKAILESYYIQRELLHTESNTYCYMILCYICYCVAFWHLSVRLRSITFQSSFESAEFGKRFVQCAKRNKKFSNFFTRHAASHYIQSCMWVVLIYTHGMKLKLTTRLSLEKGWWHYHSCLVDYLYFKDLHAFLMIAHFYCYLGHYFSL